MSELLEVLAELVFCDTQNPPRNITVDGELMGAVVKRLGPRFQYKTVDYGQGRICLHAWRGQPTLLFNVHLDTVPCGDGWTTDPHILSVDGDRAFGRGVCDIKGAAACLLTAAKQTDADVGILFTTDEEGAAACCVNSFCESSDCHPYQLVVVAEPTECLAVTSHRGYLSVCGEFTGTSGHTSHPGSNALSANHRAVQWADQALQRVADFEQKICDGHSVCFNIGRIDGGIKNNMVAERCRLTWSARLPSGIDNRSLFDRLTLPQSDFVNWQTTFTGPSLPADLRQSKRVDQFIERNGLSSNASVDFWTEASIFSRHGKAAVVLGPGNIAQAHSANEWVNIDQLETCCQIYQQIISEN